MMKILAMGDLHGHLPIIEEYYESEDYDVVVIAGDIAPDYSTLPKVNASFQTEWLDTKFFKWAVGLKKPVFGCYGNHDYGLLTKKNRRIQIYANAIIDNFLLFAWTPEFYGWNYMVKDLEGDCPANSIEGSIESRLENSLNKCKKSETPDIWVCHGPPYGICNDFQGSQALYKAIEEYQPKAVFVGHFHNGRRRGQIGNSLIYNCALVDNDLYPVYAPDIIDLEI